MLVHIHSLAVTLLVLWLLMKMVVLLLRHYPILEMLRKLRVLDPLLGLAAIGTGIALFVQGEHYHEPNWFWLKIGLLLVAIPTSIIGMKKEMPMLAVLGVAILVGIMVYAHAS